MIHHKYSRSNVNLRLQATEWNFLTPLPTSISHTRTKSNQLERITTTIGSRQKTVKPAVPSDSESENNENETIGKLSNAAKSRDQFLFWQKFDNKKNRITKKDWSLWDIKQEKCFKLARNIALPYKAKLMQSQNITRLSNTETKDGIYKKTLRNLLNEQKSVKTQRKITLPKDNTESNSKASSPCGSEAFSPKDVRKFSNFGTIWGKLKKKPREAWWVNLHKEIRELLGKFADKTAEIRAQNNTIQKEISLRAKKVTSVKSFNIGEIAMKRESCGGTPLENLRRVMRKVDKKLEEQERNKEVGFVKDQFLKTLKESKELGKWCLNLHKLRDAGLHNTKNIGKYIRSLRRNYTLIKKC